MVTSLTQAVSLGTEGANGTNYASDLQALATQVQGILTSVVSARQHFGRRAISVRWNRHNDSLHGGCVVIDRLHLQRQQRFELRAGWRPDERSGQPSRQSDLLQLQQQRAGVAELAGHRAAKRKQRADCNCHRDVSTRRSTTLASSKSFTAIPSDQLNSQEQYLQQDTVTLASQAEQSDRRE